jgi:transcription initiation factor IIE alpha subunit
MRFTLSKAIKELREAGVIKTFRHGRKDHYTFYWQAEVIEQNRQSFNDTKPERKDESGPDEFPCSQCGEGIVYVEGARCSECIHKSRQEARKPKEETEQLSGPSILDEAAIPDPIMD